jgi:hypothetical protein
MERADRWFGWQREVIERQVIVMRCTRCGERPPADRSKCKDCGASIAP